MKIPKPAWMAAIAIVLLAGPRPSTAADKLLLEASWGKGPGQMGYFNSSVQGFEEMAALGPEGLAIGPKGEIAIADTFNDRIFIYSPSGKLEQTVKAPVLKRPWAISYGSDGEVAVSLGESSHVALMGTDFKIRAAFGGRADGKSQLRQITALRVGGSGDIYCADLGANAVLAFDSLGRKKGSLPWPGTGLEVAPGELVLDLDWKENVGYAVRARKLDGQTRFLFSLPGAGLEGGRLLGLDSAGNIYARFTRSAAPGFLHVVRFDARGQSLVDLGRLPHLPSDATIRVLDDGGLVWLDYDARTAPAGTVRVMRR